MSGDVQPRKRKDKKKRKETFEEVPSQSAQISTDDVNIHVHKERTTGGEFCAKCVFFIVMAVIAVVIGLAIVEYRGQTDLETVSTESRFAPFFEGWIDKAQDNHDHEDEIPVQHSEEEIIDDEAEEKPEVIEELQAASEEDENDDDNNNELEAEREEEIEEIDVNQIDLSEEENQSEETNDDEDEDEQAENEDENQGFTIDDLTQPGDKEHADYLNREALRDLYRRNTLVPPPKIEVTEADEENNMEPLGEDENENEEELQDEVEEEEEEIKLPSATKKYEDGDEGDDEEAGDSDEELMKKLEAKYGKLPSRQANDSEEDEEKGKGNIDDEDEEDESWKRVDVTPEDEAESETDEDKATPLTKSGAQSIYIFANITNSNDYLIKDDLDEADRYLEDNTPLALSLFTKILQAHPTSPRALYGKARALDIWADMKRSNEILQDSIKFYSQVLQEKQVPNPLFIAAAERCINRLRFVGQYGKAVSVHKLLIDRFPDHINFRNQLAVSYLTINRIPEARQNLLETLKKWPEDGFALVHYGFVLKTVDNNLENAVEYLRKGLNTKEAGVIDGRFYFHLGDALARLGKRDEAMKVYEEGVNNNVFLSKYQRSLYNVNRLSARPWWDKSEMPSKTFYEDLERNWEVIRDEGLTVLNSKGFFKDESENLRDTGDWKQFELYARGIKHVKNCNKCPVTCRIIDAFPDAKSCKRGQVKFSVMHPNTHVWPHCGPTNCRLRVHLGLKVPPNTFIRVAENIRSWEEGKILIFDDSFEHEVWHNGTELRLVLIVDVWHPELTQKEKQTLSAI